jgi:hypothetical protein
MGLHACFRLGDKEGEVWRKLTKPHKVIIGNIVRNMILNWNRLMKLAHFIPAEDIVEFINMLRFSLESCEAAYKQLKQDICIIAETDDEAAEVFKRHGLLELCK